MRLAGWFLSARALVLPAGGGGRIDAGAAAPAGRIYELEARLIDGTALRLSEYRGSVLLIVNTASRCGFTPQYEGLEALHRRYADRGLRVLGFPANEFGGQEPGDEAEIRSFCSTRYAVSFDLFAKVAAKGPGIHPLFAFLTRESGHNGELRWNFTKFLVSRDGRVAARFEPEDDPLSPPVVEKLEELLG